jgi:hypothetical protein
MVILERILNEVLEPVLMATLIDVLNGVLKKAGLNAEIGVMKTGLIDGLKGVMDEILRGVVLKVGHYKMYFPFYCKMI